ncbi:DUF167 domain-containing protein [Candidatus Saccharibacteria bacterium]|nr:DUF167 domain-containing protein [Candidatus Saccharibacteria bacterium]
MSNEDLEKKYVDVQVKPSSKKGPLVQPSIDGSLLVYVREPAVDGKANMAVRALLAEYFSVPKSKVNIVSGLSTRHKRYQIF